MKRNEIVDAINCEVDNLFDEMITVLQALVRIPSITGAEGPAQAYIKKLYQASRLEVQLLEADKNKLCKHPAFCDSGKPFAGRPNIIGIQTGDPNKQSLILNAHVDVVPVEEDWMRDPWGGEIEDGKLYGRGAADCKAGLIANLFASRALRNVDLAPLGPIMLQSVIEEEDGGGGGALACFMEGFTADGMIVSEPAPWVTVALAGIIRCIIKVKGKSAHPSQSHLGVNAISKILPIYQALEQLDLRRKAEVHYPLFEENGAPACHLVIGYLRGGKWIATVAGEAEMGVRIGFIPGENTEDIKNMIESLVQKTAAQDQWLSEHPPIIEWQSSFFDSHYQDPEHPFVQSVISSLKQVESPPSTIKARGGGWSEDTRLSQFFNIPAVSFGPQGERYHGPDECVYLDSLKATTKAIALASFDWCSRDKL